MRTGFTSVLPLALLVLAGRVAMAQRPGAGGLAAGRAGSFSVVEATIPQMQAAMAAGRVTSRELVGQYLQRIGLYDRWLNAALAINPHALREAEALDRERAQGRVRGPLHGIPVALKDNIQTTDLPTTAGALAFRGFVPAYDATLVRQLREAGAIIIAKTGMIELMSYMAPMPTGYNAVGGFPFNPYDPRPDPRPATADGRAVMTIGGSSSGVGTTANLWAASVGTETYVSILSPANATMLVGLKPTVGRVSRHGVIPVSLDLDTPGPMTRTVTDAATLLGVLEGAAPDPRDRAAGACARAAGGDYTRYLERGALRGARIGVPRAYFYAPVAVAGASALPGGPGGLSPAETALTTEVIAILRRAGAVVVDSADIPSIVVADTARNCLRRQPCVTATQTHGRDADCSIVQKYGMKRDFGAWLQSLGPSAPVHSLGELREWNRTNERRGALRYGQARLDISDDVDLARDRARYEADLATDQRLARAEGIDGALQRHRVDALLFPGTTASLIASPAVYPAITVPFGFVANAPTPPLPAGFEARPRPFGISFTASRCAEPRLIALAYAFEQATRRRTLPAATP